MLGWAVLVRNFRRVGMLGLGGLGLRTSVPRRPLVVSRWPGFDLGGFIFLDIVGSQVMEQYGDTCDDTGEGQTNGRLAASLHAVTRL